MSFLGKFWRKYPRQILLTAAGIFGLMLVCWTLSARDTEPIDSFGSCANDGNLISDTNPPVCHYGKHTFLGPAVSPTPSGLPGIMQNFQILVSGDSLSRYPKRQEVITNEADWERYWRAVHASINPVPPLIPIDFNTRNVIALSEGQQLTGGYNLKVTSVIMNSAGTIVNVTETVPTMTCNVTQAASNRYFIAGTPRLTEPVTFRLTTDYHRCK